MFFCFGVQIGRKGMERQDAEDLEAQRRVRELMRRGEVA